MVITTSATSFKIIPRNYGTLDDFNVTFTNESTKVNTSLDQEPTALNGYYTFDLTLGDGLTRVEGDEFSLVIKTTGDVVIWRGKVFITNQTTQEYSIYG